MVKPVLLILAAGMGSRYGGLKQIDPIGPHGEVIVDYSIYDAIKAGFEKVVFVIRKDIEKDFKECFGSRFEKHIKVEYAYQELDMLPEGFSVPEGRTKPWGTAHAILAAKDLIDQPFAVINADDFYGKESYNVVYDFLVNNISDTTYALIGYHLKNTVSPHGSVNRGICKTLDNELISIEEARNIQVKNLTIGIFENDSLVKEISPETIVSMDFFGFMPGFFDFLEKGFINFLKLHGQEEKSEYYIPTALDELINAKEIVCKVIPNPASWFGVTYKEDKPEVISSLQKLIENGVYPKNLWE